MNLKKSPDASDKGQRYHDPFITIWHVDPDKGGDDDSCGWFMRARHADKKVLERIVKRFEFDWDRVFQSDGGSSYFCGLFTPDGDPHFSVQGVALNLFFMAAIEVFESDGRTNWKRAKKFLAKNLLDIMLFAENPTDSLFDGITRKFEIGCGEAHTKHKRDERLRNLASCIYGWILRAERPWWKHPRWHIHHWKIQVHPWQTLRRWLFDRCCKCGKRFKWGASPLHRSMGQPGSKDFQEHPEHLSRPLRRPFSSSRFQSCLTKCRIRDSVNLRRSWTFYVWSFLVGDAPGETPVRLDV